MGGFFGTISKHDCVMDLFFGTDYHSHLGTKRGGMAVYDLSLIHIFRRAEEGEELTTLDGQVRRLNANHLVIADETRAVGLAGIMGGDNSEIVSDTTDVVFESACFDGTCIRKEGQKIMVEFVSANPTGPMHMGNARGGVLGDTLASVLQLSLIHIFPGTFWL